MFSLHRHGLVHVYTYLQQHGEHPALQLLPSEQPKCIPESPVQELGASISTFLVSNSRCKSVRLELPDISNCYLRALFLPNHIEDAELCEVEGSRARAGGERHLLSRVMLCVPRASAASNQENLLDGPQLLQRQSWFFWVRFLNVFVLWRMAILKEINLKWDKDSARLSRGKGGRKRKTGQHFLLFVFQDNFTHSLREFNSVSQDKHPEAILLAL